MWQNINKKTEILYLVVNGNFKIINESQKILLGSSMGDIFYTVLDPGDRAMSWHQSLRHAAGFRERNTTCDSRELVASTCQPLSHRTQSCKAIRELPEQSALNKEGIWDCKRRNGQKLNKCEGARYLRGNANNYKLCKVAHFHCKWKLPVKTVRYILHSLYWQKI